MSSSPDAPEDPFTRALANTVRAAKDRRHHTVRSLADATGLGLSSVQRYLDAARPIPIPALRRLANALDTTAGTLLDEAEDEEARLRQQD